MLMCADKAKSDPRRRNIGVRTLSNHFLGYSDMPLPVPIRLTDPEVRPSSESGESGHQSLDQNPCTIAHCVFLRPSVAERTQAQRPLHPVRQLGPNYGWHPWTPMP